MAEILRLLSLTIFLYITSGATDPFPLESSAHYLEYRVDGLNYSSSQEVPIGQTYYENDDCLIRTNYSFGATYNGELELLAYSCDLPPTRVPIDAHFKYFFPTGSRVKILCRSYSNDCVSDSYSFTSDDHMHVEGLPLNDYETEFTVDFLRPFESRRWMTCYCDNTAGGRIHVGPISMMYSNYIPRPVTGFGCVVHEFQIATCTWDDQPELKVNWTTCIGLSNRGPTSSYHTCGEQHETKVAIPSIHWRGRYLTIINGTNEYGASTTKFNFTMDQVRLSKAVVTLATIGSKEIVVEYNHNCALNPNYILSCEEDGLSYKLTVAVNKWMTPDLENINEAERDITIDGVYYGTEEHKKSFTDFNKPFLINITHLMPYTNYNTTVIQRIGATEFWSEPSMINFQTRSANPTRGPFVHSTGFIQKGTCTDGRLVNVYWKGLDVHNGGNGVVTWYEVNNKLQPSTMREQSVCIPLRASTVSIDTMNEMGRGSVPSFLHIPSSENMIVIPTCMLRARMLRNKADKVILNWQLLTQHMNVQGITDATYTIFWCEFDDSMCQEEFDWLDVTGYTESKYVLQMKHNRTEYKYGISVSHGERSSGIIWADCLLGTAGPSKTDVTISVIPIKHNRAKVIVLPQCVDGMGMLERTQLTYCPISEDKNCVDDLPPALGHCSMEYEVPLKPGVGYSFMLSRTYADIPDAKIPEPSVSPFVLDSIDEADKATIVISFVTGVVVAMVLGISCALCYVRRQRKKSEHLTIIMIEPTEVGLLADKIEGVHS